MKSGSRGVAATRAILRECGAPGEPGAPTAAPVRVVAVGISRSVHRYRVAAAVASYPVATL